MHSDGPIIIGTSLSINCFSECCMIDIRYASCLTLVAKAFTLAHFYIIHGNVQIQTHVQ